MIKEKRIVTVDLELFRKIYPTNTVLNKRKGRPTSVKAKARGRKKRVLKNLYSIIGHRLHTSYYYGQYYELILYPYGEEYIAGPQDMAVETVIY